MQIRSDFGLVEIPNDLTAMFAELPRQSGRVVWDAQASRQFAHDLRMHIYQKNGMPKPPGREDWAIPDDWLTR